MRLREFDTAVANPSYGPIWRSADAPGYRGNRFEYHTIAVAAQVARHGVFLIPQQSAPFSYSGRVGMQPDTADAEYTRFTTGTGIVLEPSSGIDTSYCRDQWQHRPPETEVVVADFTDPALLRPARPHPMPTPPTFQERPRLRHQHPRIADHHVRPNHC